jgi:hypothetical protein
VTTHISSRTASESATGSTASRSSSTSPNESSGAAPSRARDRRIAAAAALLAILALGAVLFTRGGDAATDTTAKLMPAGALAYAHLSTADRTQDARLRSIAGRFGAVRTALPRLAAALSPAAAGLDFEKDIRPWLGDDAAVAVLDGGTPMLVASVRDRGAAGRLLDRLGATPAGAYKGVALRQLKPSATVAIAGDHLVAGPAAEVRAAIDRDAGTGTPSLADNRVYRRAAATRSGAATLDVFAPSLGLRRALDGRTGIAGVAGRLLASPTLDGVDAQFTAEETGVRVNARVLRVPGAKRPAGYTPSLAARAPANAAGFLSLPGLDAAADAIVRLGGGPTIDAITGALPTAAGIELDDLIAPLSDEAQITVTGGGSGPVFTVAARTHDEDSTRGSLARLQRPLGERLAGGAPFTQLEQGGATGFSVNVTPELQPTYAVSKGAVVASTARSGLDQLAPAKAPLTDNEVFKKVMPDGDAKVEALGFLDSRQLLALAERTGLAALSSPAVRDDLGRIKSASAVVEEDGDHSTDTTAELFLQIP